MKRKYHLTFKRRGTMNATPYFNEIARWFSMLQLDAVMIGNAAAAIHGTPVTTPTGFPRIARGCAYPRYPGNTSYQLHNPKGVASSSGQSEIGGNPFGVVVHDHTLPGVARVRATPGCKRQPPWGCFGIDSQ